MADEQPRLLELREHAVDRGEPDVEAFGQQLPVDVLGGQVPQLRRLEQVDDLEPRQRRLEAGVLEVVGRGHRGGLGRSARGAAAGRRGGAAAAIIADSSRHSQARANHSCVRPAGSPASHGRPSPRPRSPSLAVAALARAAARRSSTYMPTMRAFGVYKLDINQGNYLTQDMVDKLKVGQTHAAGARDPRHAAHHQRVPRRTAGTTSTSSSARARSLEHRSFAVYFVDDKLARWEGDEMPPSMAELNRARVGQALPAARRPSDKGFLAWLLGPLPRSDAVTRGSRSPAPAAGWARR